MNKQTKSEKRAMQEEWMVRFCYPEIAWANSPAQISEIELTEKEAAMFKFVLSQIARREVLKSENGQRRDINILQ